MKRKILVLLAVLGLGFILIAQTPTRETWEDFAKTIGNINRVNSDIQHIYDQIIELEKYKVEIIDNPERRGRLIVLLNVHPDYDADWVLAKLDKLTTLRQYLQNNGYIQ